MRCEQVVDAASVTFFDGAMRVRGCLWMDGAEGVTSVAHGCVEGCEGLDEAWCGRRLGLLVVQGVEGGVQVAAPKIEGAAPGGADGLAFGVGLGRLCGHCFGDFLRQVSEERLAGGVVVGQVCDRVDHGLFGHTDSHGHGFAIRPGVDGAFGGVLGDGASDKDGGAGAVGSARSVAAAV